MGKFYRVFVSSTFIDLREERQAVMQALLELNCMPSGMELFPASDETALELIKRELADCDYYVCIVGGRYGSLDPEGISYTEREYDFAVNNGIPVLGFLPEDPRNIPVGKSDADQGRLAAFRDKVARRHCRKWKNADDLGRKVVVSLTQMFSLFPRDGWVRASAASAASDELFTLKEKNAQLTQDLITLRTHSALEERERVARSAGVPVHAVLSPEETEARRVLGLAKMAWDGFLKTVMREQGRSTVPSARTIASAKLRLNQGVFVPTGGSGTREIADAMEKLDGVVSADPTFDGYHVVLRYDPKTGALK